MSSSSSLVNPYAAPAVLTTTEAAPGADVFDRQVFLLRQKVLTISEKYCVWDEQGNELLQIHRPRHLLRNLGAVAAALLSGVFTLALTISIAANLPEPIKLLGVVVSFPVALVLAGVVGTVLSAKRHVHFYRDASRRELLLRVEQDQKFAPLVATFTVKDPDGKVLAKLDKNYLFNLFRRRWQCHSPQGELLSVIREDSLVKSIARRLLGPMLGLLRTNFVFFDGDSEREIARFDRQFTLRDHYVLDLRPDTRQRLDRRVALAIGVMLDTGERR